MARDGPGVSCDRRKFNIQSNQSIPIPIYTSGRRLLPTSPLASSSSSSSPRSLSRLFSSETSEAAAEAKENTAERSADEELMDDLIACPWDDLEEFGNKVSWGMLELGDAGWCGGRVVGWGVCDGRAVCLGLTSLRKDGRQRPTNKAHSQYTYTHDIGIGTHKHSTTSS